MELKGSQTEKNLWTAFAGESEARNKYTYYASVAKREGYEQIMGVFLETADNEKEHAKMWAKFLGIIGDTRATLRMPQAVKITNGQICTPVLQKPPGRKGLRK